MRKLVLTIALLTIASAALAQHHHGPIVPLRQPNGLIARGVHQEFQTGNWSGYATATWQTGQNYTSASATWQVPSVTYGPINTIFGYPEYVSGWVGIGGYCQNAGCTSVDPSLIQLGWQAGVARSGSPSFAVWYETLPAAETALPSSYVVQPGDIMTASLQCTANCTPGAAQTWKLVMTDVTEGWSWNTTVEYQSSLASAESILEAPYSGGILPLPDYGQANFDPFLANGTSPGLTLATNGIDMVDTWGQTSNPSAPVAGDQFSTCYGAGTTLASCTATPVGTSSPPPPSPPPPAPSQAPTAFLTASPATVFFGQTSTLTWGSSNATTCSGSPSAFNTGSATSGQDTVEPFLTTTYTVSCSNAAGQSTTASATVNVGALRLGTIP
jgi:hypothetical protein